MKRSKTILYLANRVPYPPDKGDKIRTFHQIEHLSRSHDVYCGCFAESPSELDYAQVLRKWCREVIAIPWRPVSAALGALPRWLSGHPLTVAAYASRAMRRGVARLSACVELDAVVAFSSMMAPYALAVRAVRRVVDLCDVDSEKWADYARDAAWPMSSLCTIESRRLRAAELRCLERFDAVTLITDAERELLPQAVDAEHVAIIGNGVNVDERLPTAPSQSGPIVGFAGTMDYAPNVQAVTAFVRDVWPRVLRVLPSAWFHIIGRRPTRAVRELSRVPGVQVTGRVDDVAAELLKCRAVVAPLKIARGIPNKVLEAMAARRPVVASAAVVGTIRAMPGRDWLIADEPVDVARSVVTLLRRDGLCDAIGDAGRRFVMVHHDWEREMTRFERIVLGDESPARREMRRRAQIPREAIDGSSRRSWARKPVVSVLEDGQPHNRR